MPKAHLLLIATGGTIASVETESGLTPGLPAEALLSYLPELEALADIEAVQLMNLDSTNIQASDWLAMARLIEDAYDDFDGFVICHGTDTLAYTAAALSYLIQDSPKPIVLTGSQKPINLANTDARINLRDSLLLAATPGACEVSIVFNGKVICGTRAQKVKTHSYDAFDSINFPYIASIHEGQVFFYWERTAAKEPSFFHKMDSSVGLVKLIPSLRSESLVKMAEDYRAMVIEAYGLGGLPSNSLADFPAAVAQLTQEGKLVVMTTQVALEGSNMSVYRVGKTAKEELGLVEAYDMTLPAVVTKLMWALGQAQSREEVEALFARPVNRDSLWRRA